MPIPDFEGLYEASSLGRIKRLSRILKQQSSKLGYLYITLCKNNIKTSKLVHRLIAQSFHGNCPRGMECAHLDGIRTNNKVENLKWVTPKENQAHRKLHGTDNIGDNASQAILTNHDIPVIRKRRSNGETYKSIAKDYGVHLSTIQYAVNGRNWGHIK